MVYTQLGSMIMENSKQEGGSQPTLNTKKKDSRTSFRLFVGRTMASMRLRRSKKTASTSTRGPLLPPLFDFFEVADVTGSSC